MHTETIDVIVLEDASERSLHQGYKYILKGLFAFSAFKNDEQFDYFLKATGQTVVPCDQPMWPFQRQALRLKYPVHETLFSFLTDIKDLDKATKFSDLSNGKYVACYTYIKDGVCWIFKPNPNYEEVYVPRSELALIEPPVSSKDAAVYDFTITLPHGKLPEDIQINIHFNTEGPI